LFAQTLADNLPIWPFIVLSKVESTNNYAMAKLHARLLDHGTCLLALEQTAGKGQRGKQWTTRPGENITMSTVLQPPSYKPFVYSAAIALSCYDFIKALGADNVKVKWPNDIYIGDRKAAGILIENIYHADRWEWAVAGTGINLNQEEFPPELSRAISVKQATGLSYDLTVSGRLLHKCIRSRHEWVKSVSSVEVMDEYNAMLYKRGEKLRLKHGSIVFDTVIDRVEEDGSLISNDVIERRFVVGEVEFL
jgi:BirA family biotin operon repressor/biotin-[acetyl-CoA-carboxylase] ligase